VHTTNYQGKETEVRPLAKNWKLVGKEVIDFKISKIQHLTNMHSQQLLNSLWISLYFSDLLVNNQMK